MVGAVRAQLIKCFGLAFELNSGVHHGTHVLRIPLDVLRIQLDGYVEATDTVPLGTDRRR